MIYAVMNDGIAVGVATAWRGYDTESRNDWKTFDRVVTIADQLTANTGKLYLPIDHGRNVSPRYDVIAAPISGAPVSRAFNGDYYPAGFIKSISATFKRIETNTGIVFWRRGRSASWIADGTWSMVSGHITQFNPSF
jgi:hypothetical protein